MLPSAADVIPTGNRPTVTCRTTLPLSTLTWAMVRWPLSATHSDVLSNAIPSAHLPTGMMRGVSARSAGALAGEGAAAAGGAGAAGGAVGASAGAAAPPQAVRHCPYVVQQASSGRDARLLSSAHSSRTIRQR